LRYFKLVESSFEWSFENSTGLNNLIIIIITDLYSAFISEDTEALDAAQED